MRSPTPASSTTDLATTATAVEPIVLPAARSHSPGAAAWRRLLSSPVARAGLGIVTLFVLIAVIAPVAHEYDPKVDSNLGLRLKPPGAEHPFGTDSLGRDILVRVL